MTDEERPETDVALKHHAAHSGDVPYKDQVTVGAPEDGVPAASAAPQPVS
jgi:hypothetical protein